MVLTHYAERRLGDAERALQVHGHYAVPVLFRLVVKGAISEDTGVVDDDVYLAVGVQRRLDDRLSAFGGVDTIVVRGRLAAGGLDLAHHLVRHGGAGAGAVSGASEVVHDDLCAARGEEEGVGAAKSAAGPGDNSHAVIESNFTHVRPPKKYGRILVINFTFCGPCQTAWMPMGVWAARASSDGPTEPGIGGIVGL